MDDPKNLLQARGTTHGVWDDNAKCMDDMLNLWSQTNNWHTLTPRQRIALNLIALKISRILTGNPDFKDHWDDIVGYAMLGLMGEMARH